MFVRWIGLSKVVRCQVLRTGEFVIISAGDALFIFITTTHFWENNYQTNNQPQDINYTVSIQILAYHSIALLQEHLTDTGGTRVLRSITNKTKPRRHGRHKTQHRKPAEEPVNGGVGQAEVQRAVRSLDAVGRGRVPQVLHQGQQDELRRPR